MMRLTLENLINFLQEKYPDEAISSHSILRNGLFCSIDGDEAVELMFELENTFHVDFKQFHFSEYFLSELEITRKLTFLGMFRKLRKIQKELTINDLYEYMISHKK